MPRATARVLDRFQNSGLDHFSIVFPVLCVLSFPHIIDPEDESHLRSETYIDVAHIFALFFGTTFHRLSP